MTLSPAQRVEIRQQLGEFTRIVRTVADTIDEAAPTLPTCPGEDCPCEAGGLTAILMSINAVVYLAMTDRDLILAWLASEIGDDAVTGLQLHAPKEIPHA